MAEAALWRLDAERIAGGLGTRRIGRTIQVVDDTDSTNTFVLDQWAKGRGAEADGWVLFAEHQSAGRGRLGRSWHSPRGASLMFTALLWERAAPRSAARWVLAAGVAVAQGVADVTDLSPTIRWPNDVFIGTRKLAGVLVESRGLAGGWAIAIGVGVNCSQQAGHFPPELAAKATSIEIESSQPVDRPELARAMLRRLDALLADRQGDDELSAAWHALSGDLGVRVMLRENGREYRGRILDVNPTCGLLVQLDDGGRREFDAATTTRVE